MNSEYSGYSHGYGGNTGQQQQQAGGNSGYDYYQQQQQNQQQKYGYGDQAYTSYGTSDYTATTTAAPHMGGGGGGRADEYYNGGGEGKSYDNGFYPSEAGGEGEDGERGLKDAFVRTELDSYGMEHEKYNKTNIALAAGAVAVGAYFLKRKFDKSKQVKETQMMQQEIGDHYSMMDGKSQFGPGSYHPGGIPGGAPHPPPPAGNPYGGY